jgi:hypothetical protein
MRKPALVIALCALVVGACGGGGSDKEKAADVVNDYIGAFVDKDFGKVCDLLTPEAKKQIEDAGASLGGGGCDKTLEAITKLIDQEDLDKLKDIDVSADDVKVDGNSATVEGAALPGGQNSTRLEKTDGDWRVAPDS